MPRTLTILVSGLLLAAVGAGAVVATSAASGADKMTICHIPSGNPGEARTMEIPRSAWSGHKGHGDHEGACDGSEARAPGSAPPAPVQPPRAAPTRIALSQEAEGHLDGDATFDVVVANQGEATALDVRVSGTLRGEGSWAVVSGHGLVTCGIDSGRVSCVVGDIPAGGQVAFRLGFDGDPAVCREARADLTLSAGNDSSSSDNRDRESVRVGACSPLDPPAPVMA